MLAGLKTNTRDSFWVSNLRTLFQVFCKKGATKHSFSCFQYFLTEFTDCIDVDYILCGLRALSTHHSLILWNDLLCYHSLLDIDGEISSLSWNDIFNEFRTNLSVYVKGSMFIHVPATRDCVFTAYLVIQYISDTTETCFEDNMQELLSRNSGIRDWQSFIEVYHMGTNFVLSGELT